PLKGSINILIFKYVSGGREALVKIMYYPSGSEASRSFQSFGAFAATRNLKKLQNLSDEAFSWGLDDSIVMRKGNLNIYVEAGTDIGGLLPEIETAETAALSRTEGKL